MPGPAGPAGPPGIGLSGPKVMLVLKKNKNKKVVRSMLPMNTFGCYYYLEKYTLTCLQGTVGRTGLPGPPGLPGEGIQGPKVTG